MDLTVTERLMILDLLPKEGTYVTLKLIRVLREELSFNNEENQALKFKYEGNQVLWDDGAAATLGTKEVEIPQTMIDVILARFGSLDEAGKLTMDHLPVYERILETDSQEREEKDEWLDGLLCTDK